MAEPRKIVVIGAECSGKSTLCEALAKELNTLWVPEYARDYLDGLARPYEEPDLLEIARGQIGLEDQLASQTSNYLICDTDLNVQKVWSEARYDRCHHWVLETIATRPYDLYLLADCNLPWTPDPQREHPNPSDRRRFYLEYRDIVTNSGISWTEVKGNEQERLYQALAAIKSV
jgi:NadR type nicotinamide-nucleotide adenylyltransferase